MAVPGKTQKFQSLSNQVKGQTKPQEPLISTDQITQLFDDFWYQPERADLTYWSHQPESSKTKLVNELKARRDEEQTAQKETQAKQQGPSHLTNQQITSLYSEYGFPTPKSSSDFEWIRQNFPDDEQKIRAIFDEKRKQMDQMMKIQGKNTIDRVKQQSMPMAPQNNMPILNNQWGWQGGRYGGQWWPTDGQGAGATWGVKWVFPTRYVPIKFTGDPNWSAEGDEKTIWLLDSQDKTIRPFLSMTAFQNFYGDSAINALKQVANFDPQDLLSWEWASFQMYGNAQGINNDGQVPKVEATPQQLKKNYGQPEDPTTLGQSTYAVDGLFDLWLTDKWSGLDVNGIQAALQDPIIMEKYARAVTAGGYSFNDIYRDLKSKELKTNVQIIDPVMTKTDYLKTSAGQASQSLTNLDPPAQYGQINSSVFNNPITQGSSGLNEIVKILVPPLDMTSPEAKAQMDQVHSAFYDILTAKINANTEAAKAQADGDYQTFRDYLEKTYGFKLSADATQGWQQLQQITANNSNAWLSGSGIEKEQVDNSLKMIREQDSQIRTQEMNDTEKAAAEKAKASASPEEVAKMTPEERQRWWFTPSQSTLDALSISALKAKYPTATDAELNAMRSQILDENGNYRSSLYQTRSDNLLKVTTGSTLESSFNDKTQNKLLADAINQIEPGAINASDLNWSQEEFQRLTVQLKDFQARKKAEAPFLPADPSNPLGNVGSTTSTPTTLVWTQTTPGAPANDTSSIQDQARIDAANASNKAASDAASKQDQANIDAAVAANKAASDAASKISNTLSNKPTPNNAAWQTYIPNVADMGKYTNITKPDANKKIYGTPINPPVTTTPTITTPTDPAAGRIKIPNLAIMGTYKPNQYDRIGTSVYLKSGVKQTW